MLYYLVKLVLSAGIIVAVSAFYHAAGGARAGIAGGIGIEGRARTLSRWGAGPRASLEAVSPLVEDPLAPATEGNCLAA